MRHQSGAATGTGEIGKLPTLPTGFPVPIGRLYSRFWQVSPFPGMKWGAGPRDFSSQFKGFVENTQLASSLHGIPFGFLRIESVMIGSIRIFAFSASMLMLSVGTAPADPSNLQGRALGQYVFLSYCAGCHGFDGQAFFPNAPSFAMGERLLKSDEELMRSIRRGRDAMPSWEDKLPEQWLVESLSYVRHISKPGTTLHPNDMPDYFFIFTPMGTDMILDWGVEVP